MKKILFILTTTLALSIVVFGFSMHRSVKPITGSISKKAFRFHIDHPFYNGKSLPAEIRVINKITGAVVYNEIIPLTRKNGKYVTEPIFLMEGNFQVEAITRMPDSTRSTFISTHMLVSNY